MAAVPIPFPCPFMFHGQDFQLIKEPPFWDAGPGRLDMLPAQLLSVSIGFGTEPTTGEKLPRGACGKMVLRNEGA